MMIMYFNRLDLKKIILINGDSIKDTFIMLKFVIFVPFLIGLFAIFSWFLI